MRKDRGKIPSTHLASLLDSLTILLDQNVPVVKVCCLTISFYVLWNLNGSFRASDFLRGLNGYKKYVTQP